MKYLPVAQFGSALASGARGPEFKSRRADHKKNLSHPGKVFLLPEIIAILKIIITLKQNNC